ncbi:MAG: hypothetical protein ABL949_12325 [Fimbriimonadaceae bacterium]
MRLFRLLLPSAVIAISAFANSQPSSTPGIWVPNSTEGMPKYWTWTNCRASGSAVSNAGYIAAAWLYVDTQLVNSFQADGEWGPMSINLKAMWDSSHFTNGAAVVATFTILDMEYGFWPTLKTKTGFTTVKNRVPIYEHHDAIPIRPLSDGIDVAETKIGAMGYLTHKHKWDRWANSTVEADSYNATAVYTNTHGAASTIGTDVSGNPVYASHVYGWRLPINGTGFPPYNSTGNPPTNYVHMENCNSNYNNSFTQWFWPYYNHYGGYVEDQAVFGYTGLTDWHDNAVMALIEWPELINRKTIVQMRDKLITVSLSSKSLGLSYVRIDKGAGWRCIEFDTDCPVYGDQQTRFKGVYTGTNTVAPNDWWRPL